MSARRPSAFLAHAELTARLLRWAHDHPDVMTLASAGRSHEGRELWLATLTDGATGAAIDKPAVFVDANIHGCELAGSTAALDLIEQLLTRRGEDERVARALTDCAFYIMPRVNPDAAELAFATPARFVRESLHQIAGGPAGGLREQDVDGDGRVLTMRVPDPAGAWMRSPRDPRLLVERAPDDLGRDGPYYRLMAEGLIDGGDARTIGPPTPAIDLNRNFPAGWASRADGSSGPTPASEPEVRAVLDALVARPNVIASISYHTHGGLHLRPFATRPDDALPRADLLAYRRIGEAATAITGYPAASIFHDFTPPGSPAMNGLSQEWLHESRGALAWTTELWNPLRDAGIETENMLAWNHSHPVEDDLALLRWSDERFGGRAYVDWYPFDHPQLGPVELGGWDWMHFWMNPPPELLHDEVAPHADFALLLALIAPRLEFRDLLLEPLDGDAHRISVLLCNTGWLPSNVTQAALDGDLVEPIEIELTLPHGAVVVAGAATARAPHLAGRCSAWAGPFGGRPERGTDDRVALEWVVRGAAGDELGLEARHPRCGRARMRVPLPTAGP